MSKRFDVIIMLGGGISNNRKLSETAKYRVEKAVSLFNKEKAPYLIMSGADSRDLNVKPKITEAEGMKIYAHRLGAPKKYILKEEKSKDTIGNAYFT